MNKLLLKSPILFTLLIIPESQAFNVDASQPLTVYSMFMGADWVVKSVMALLFLASIISWSILLIKKTELNTALKSCTLLKQTLSKDVTLTTIVETYKSNKTALAEYLLITDTLKECDWSEHNKSTATGVKERVAQKLISRQSELADQAALSIGILASIGSTAPFIGLFGTVWGIMNSFIGIAEAKNTNLAVVAPGIAEALLATAAGLLAAIPAVLFYNYFSRRIGYYKKQLKSISADLMILASRHLEQQG